MMLSSHTTTSDAVPAGVSLPADLPPDAATRDVRITERDIAGVSLPADLPPDAATAIVLKPFDASLVSQCAWCGLILDGVNQGKRQPLAAYATHGICDVCGERLLARNAGSRVKRARTCSTTTTES